MERFRAGDIRDIPTRQRTPENFEPCDPMTRSTFTRGDGSRCRDFVHAVLPSFRSQNLEPCSASSRGHPGRGEVWTVPGAFRRARAAVGEFGVVR